jgi:hypothetical protein
MKPVSDPDVLAQLNAPARGDVPSTGRVWGDREAEAAGLYETPTAAPSRRAVTDPALLAQLNGEPAGPQIDARFGEFAPPQNAEALQSGLHSLGAARTRGPAVDPGVTVSIEGQNQAIAAGQRTTPNINAQMKSLISDQVFENDAGLAVFRDPATGNLIEAQDNQHVILRDPADNRLKVFARTENTDEGALSAGGRLLGTGFAAGAVTRRPAIPTPSAKSIEVKASDIFATAKPHYRSFDKASDAFGNLDTSTYAQRIKDAMRAGKVPQHLADEVYRSVDEIGETGSLAGLRSVKELIGQSARSNDSRVRQAAGIASKEINKIIGEVSREAGQSLRTADEIYSTAKSVQDLQRKGAVADLRAGRAGYGGSAVNSMRQVLSPIVQRAVEGKMTGFRPNEIEAMREIVEGTVTTNALRGVGQLSPSKGILQTIGAAGGAATFGPAALAIPAMGAASNKLATVLTGQQIGRLKELVAKRSPAYAEAVKKSVERYEKAQAALVSQPGSNKVAAFIASARDLASGLTRDGIQVSSADLIRAIQGPVRGAADDEKPEPVGVRNQ